MSIANEERWRAVPGFPGYEVSDHGNVRSWWTGHTGRSGKPRYIGEKPESLTYQRECASWFGVAQATLRAALNGKTWRSAR